MTDQSVPVGRWTLATRHLTLERTRIMGVLNVTPDSFSDGGRYRSPSAAIAHGMRMAEAGADIVDIGGESTRPGANAVSVAEELDRVMPVIAGLREAGVIVSIDTMKAEVARTAIAGGAEIVNDVSGFRSPEMRQTAARSGAGVVVMHMQGEPRTMQNDPHYGDVVAEVGDYLAGQVRGLVEAGVASEAIVVDPGIGFGKTLDHNLALLRNLERLVKVGRPVLIGPSRKRFLGTITGHADATGRDLATGAVVALAIGAGASIVRVHNVAVVREVVQVADAIVRATWPLLD